MISRVKLPFLCLAILSGLLAAQSDPYANLPKTHILPDQLPEIYATRSVSNPPKVVPMPNGAVLQLPPGFIAREVASNLERPRAMILAPNGDVFLSEPRADRVSVHRDTDGDGVFDLRWVFSDKLSAPFGLAFVDDWLYIGNTTSLVRLPYAQGQTTSADRPEKLLDLPGGGHWTRGLLYHKQENKLYISVGSRGNIGEPRPHRAAILRCDLDGTNVEVFASGLRNPIAMDREPVTGAIWTVVNERDGLGDDLVPDYATRVIKGGFYGWPYSYIGSHPMPGYARKRPDLVKAAIVPDVLFESHSAALGLVFYTADAFPEHFRGGAFAAFHGSWNRAKRTGYQVVYLPFNSDGSAKGYYESFLEGWRETPSEKTVWGRPVGLLVDRDGSLLVSDDGNNKIWRVTYVGD